MYVQLPVRTANAHERWRLVTVTDCGSVCRTAGLSPDRGAVFPRRRDRFQAVPSPQPPPLKAGPLITVPATRRQQVVLMLGRLCHRLVQIIVHFAS